MAQKKSENWIRFVRKYGPIPRNDNMYDEHILKSSRRIKIQPISFTHPLEKDIVNTFSSDTDYPRSLILTGTAGDGKSHLCGKVWYLIGGDENEWDSEEIYYLKKANVAGVDVNVHIIRDLTALPDEDDKGRYESKHALLHQFCDSVLDYSTDDIYLIAANDGQLIESWQRLEKTKNVEKALKLFEKLLFEDARSQEGVPLHLFNLSTVPSSTLFDLAIEAFVNHESWNDCYNEAVDEGLFSERCPIRHNYELLKQPLVQQRLRALMELCDCNGFHIPIRRILLLLSNAVLGHPEVKDRLMMPLDVKKIICEGKVSKASIYNNIFGGNLTPTRRETLEVFEYLNAFGIGHETSNRIDNILIFGKDDENLSQYFDDFLAADTFYGADESYYAAQREYVEGNDEDNSEKTSGFLELLVSKRRGLFFKIPIEQENELSLWELTVFKYAGEFLSRVVGVLNEGKRVERPILNRLVKGLNRVFVGMLVTTDRELIMATGLSYSNAKVSHVLEDRISVERRLGEGVDICMENGKPALIVSLSEKLPPCVLPLNLMRYEFLNRVAEGALPGSFSKECYEDILAFKSKVLAVLSSRRQSEVTYEDSVLTFRLLRINSDGQPFEDIVEVNNG